MSASLVHCSMCGFEYDPAHNKACGSCPLQKGCDLVCCPACGYQSVNVQRSVLARLAASMLSAHTQVTKVIGLENSFEPHPHPLPTCGEERRFFWRFYRREAPAKPPKSVPRSPEGAGVGGEGELTATLRKPYDCPIQGVRRSANRVELTLADVPPGSKAMVGGFLEGMPVDRQAQLQAYGLVANDWVQVLQQAPVTVIQIDHTELALEGTLASQIKVERIG